MNPSKPGSSPDRPRLVLVDFENVPQVDLSRLDDSFRIVIFVGASQKSVPIELVTSAQKLGSRIEWMKVAGEGRNALDFFIAWQLGRVFERTPRPECFVLSKDKGFDPLLRHLNANGLQCRRVTDLHDLATARPAQAPSGPSAASYRPEGETPYVQRVMSVLGKSEKRSRPRKRRTLAQAISAMFQKKLSKQDVDYIIDNMLKQKLISEHNGIFTYEF